MNIHFCSRGHFCPGLLRPSRRHIRPAARSWRCRLVAYDVRLRPWRLIRGARLVSLSLSRGLRHRPWRAAGSWHSWQRSYVRRHSLWHTQLHRQLARSELGSDSFDARFHARSNAFLHHLIHLLLALVLLCRLLLLLKLLLSRHDFLAVRDEPFCDCSQHLATTSNPDDPHIDRILRVRQELELSLSLGFTLRCDLDTGNRDFLFTSQQPC